MRLKFGVISALLLFVLGCSSGFSIQEQLGQLAQLQASLKASISSSPSPTFSAFSFPSIIPAASAAPLITPQPEKKVNSKKPENSQAVGLQQDSNKIPLFRNCTEAKENGYSDISVVEHPEYAFKDRDKDGIACES